MTDIYVTGTSVASGAGSGTENDPWYFEDVFDGTKSAVAGDRVLFKGGTISAPKETTPGYDWDKNYPVTALTGTASQPIHIMPVPGEYVRIDGGFAVDGSSAHLCIHDLDFYNDTPRPATIGPGSNPVELTDWGACGVALSAGAGHKVYNNVIRDGIQSLSVWTPATDAEIYGNICFGYGWLETVGLLGHGHAIYTQNQAGTKVFRHNIFAAGKYAKDYNRQYAFHAYSETGDVSNLVITENLMLGAVRLESQANPSEGISFVDNTMASMRVGSTGADEGDGISVGYNGHQDKDVTFTGQQVLNSVVRVKNNLWDTETVSGVEMWKTVATWQEVDEGTLPGVDPPETATFTDVSAGTGTDKADLYANIFDPGRAMLRIIDLDGDGTVDVSAALSTFLSIGDSYRIQHYSEVYSETNTVPTKTWDGSQTLSVTEEISVDGVLEIGAADGFVVFKETESPEVPANSRLSDAVKALLDTGTAKPRIFLELEFTSGTERYWTGGYIGTFFGKEWAPVPHGIIGYSGVEASQDMRANGVEVSVIGAPREALGGTLLAANYKGQPAQLTRALLDSNDKVAWMRTAYFFIDTLDYDLKPEAATVTVGLETEMRYLGRTLVRRYTDQDQKQEYPSDRVFEFVAYLNSGVNVLWGQAGAFFR